MSALKNLLSSYRAASLTEREKGTYFEGLILTYLRHEPVYAELYEEVLTFADWAKRQGNIAKDTGIDLVAITHTGEAHAFQCKFYAADHRIQKKDIDSFFTASGQKPFTHRYIVTTVTDWSENAEKSLIDQHIPVSRIDLHDLETSFIDWEKYQPSKEPVFKEKFPLRPHQEKALRAVVTGLTTADRGKLIMACGTGKTFTSLKIAEEIAGPGKRVLFLVPSLSLLSQTLTEWTQQSGVPLHSFAVCSDSEVGKKQKKAAEDIVETLAHELRYPATTDPRHLARAVLERHDAQHMSVVFSTYHSIQRVSDAQHLHGLEDFDLIVCDEAHRTTGATFEDERESAFIKVHDPEFLRSAKRLYMTATPRIYGDVAKASAIKDSITLASMDDESLYGKQLHIITFSEAVELDLLTDYKVIVLTVDAAHIDARIQDLLKSADNSLKVDDAARIIGCWKALSKQNVKEDLGGDTDPMRRAVAFCQRIEVQSGNARTHQVSSKQIAGMFSKVVEAYQKSGEESHPLKCEADHVDGSMNAAEKEAKLTWLKEDAGEDTCRILSNVRCLSEGVDVPALDAVLFLTPRNSQVDVVQSVGRVMRRAPGKKRGYVILPVVIPENKTPSEALDDNQSYRVVWEVLQALRSHDDRFDALLNKLDLIGEDPRKMEVISITDEAPQKPGKATPSGNETSKHGKGGESIGTKSSTGDAIGAKGTQRQFHFEPGTIERALYAKVVKKCGNRNYWDEWAKDIAKIAQTHITRITNIVQNPHNKKEAKAFTDFAAELRDDLNDSITDAEVIEMLAQHLITKPVFDALFKDYSFASHNPVSTAMQAVLDILNEHRLDKEADTLEKFYKSVERRADGIENTAAKQKIIVELYDKFFRNAFPRMTERLGIVYTPVEVVDFIIHSVNDLLKQEFGQTLGCEGVHIIDPFTGTGTFITRLLQSGLITKEQLPHKYKHEIHANEIVLLAYYIAAINIEAVYHGIVGGKYQPFQGICLTDTFRLEETDLISDLLANNSERRKRLQKLDVRVIMGNPPYSAGQESANDNNQNVSYPDLDARIRGTYATGSTATNKNALYDSYIRAIRWASDRIGKSGIIGFVTNAGFLEANTADGMRKCLAEEFSSIYVFHLRGNQRTSGELSRREGGKVFGSGSRSPIAVTLLVKNPDSSEHGKVCWHDIGDYLSQKEKLEIIDSYKSVNGITQVKGWTIIQPDAHHDWINQRDDSFEQFISIGDKKNKSNVSVFESYSSGIKTNRDAWCYNFSKSETISNMQRMIDCYHEQLRQFTQQNPRPKVDLFINTDGRKISWNRGLKNDFVKEKQLPFKAKGIYQSLYRPFTKEWAYFDKDYNDMVYQMPKIFPTPEAENLVICVTGLGESTGFHPAISNILPNLHYVAGGQCFPLYLYEKTDEASDTDLFSKSGESSGGYTRRDAITDAGLGHFRKAYGDAGKGITKEDLFYYIYGLLHSPEYRSRYADNLSKELPRIPAVKKFADFMAFSKAGRELADWHLNYETSAMHEDIVVDVAADCIRHANHGEGGAWRMQYPRGTPSAATFRVEKMKFAKTKDSETNKNVNDKTTVIYNPHITLRNIPLEAYDYVVNGKPALEWVMERQSVTTDKKSGIVNDANLWATETMNNPAYPMELFLRVAKVSMETVRIVKSLPRLEID